MKLKNDLKVEQKEIETIITELRISEAMCTRIAGNVVSILKIGD